jgi:hypothetical protein
MCIFWLGRDVGSEHVCVVRGVRNTFIGNLQKFMSWIFSRERTVHLFYFTLLFMPISKLYKICSQQGGSVGRASDFILEVSGSSIWLFTDFRCYYSARRSWSPFRSRIKVKMSDFHCCTVHLDNIKIIFTNECTIYWTYKMLTFTIKTSMH